MLRYLSVAAIAATLAFVPVAGFGSSQPEVHAAAAVAPAQPRIATTAAASAAAFGVDLAHAQAQDSGLAPGQTAANFQAWLGSSPANGARLTRFRDYLAAAGVDSVVPFWQLVRTSS